MRPRTKEGKRAKKDPKKKRIIISYISNANNNLLLTSRYPLALRLLCINFCLLSFSFLVIVMAAHDVNRMDYPRETEQKGVDDVDEEFQTASYYFGRETGSAQYHMEKGNDGTYRFRLGWNTQAECG